MNPYIPIPLAFREAIAKATLDDAHSHYSPSSGNFHYIDKTLTSLKGRTNSLFFFVFLSSVCAIGDLHLLEALSEDFRNNFGLSYSPNQFVICPGPKVIIFVLLYFIFIDHICCCRMPFLKHALHC